MLHGCIQRCLYRSLAVCILFQLRLPPRDVFETDTHLTACHANTAMSDYGGNTSAAERGKTVSRLVMIIKLYKNSYGISSIYQLRSHRLLQSHMHVGRTETLGAGLGTRFWPLSPSHCRCPDRCCPAIFICTHVVHVLVHLCVIIDNSFSTSAEVIEVVISQKHPPLRRPLQSRLPAKSPRRSRRFPWGRSLRPADETNHRVTPQGTAPAWDRHAHWWL